MISVDETDKWDGYSKTILEHVRLLLGTLQYACETIDSRYHIYKSVVHAEILLEIIEYETLNSLTKLKSSERIKSFILYNFKENLSMYD